MVPFASVQPIEGASRATGTKRRKLGQFWEVVPLAATKSDPGGFGTGQQGVRERTGKLHKQRLGQLGGRGGGGAEYRRPPKTLLLSQCRS